MCDKDETVCEIQHTFVVVLKLPKIWILRAIHPHFPIIHCLQISHGYL